MAGVVFVLLYLGLGGRGANERRDCLWRAGRKVKGMEQERIPSRKAQRGNCYGLLVAVMPSWNLCRKRDFSCCFIWLSLDWVTGR